MCCEWGEEETSGGFSVSDVLPTPCTNLRLFLNWTPCCARLLTSVPSRADFLASSEGPAAFSWPLCPSLLWRLCPAVPVP